MRKGFMLYVDNIQCQRLVLLIKSSTFLYLKNLQIMTNTLIADSWLSGVYADITCLKF